MSDGARIECVDGDTFEVWNGGVLLATCPSEHLAKLVLEGLSPRLDSRALENFAAGLELCRKAVKQHHQNCVDARGESVDFMRAFAQRAHEAGRGRTLDDESDLDMTWIGPTKAERVAEIVSETRRLSHAVERISGHDLKVWDVETMGIFRTEFELLAQKVARLYHSETRCKNGHVLSQYVDDVCLCCGAKEVP